MAPAGAAALLFAGGAAAAAPACPYKGVLADLCGVACATEHCLPEIDACAASGSGCESNGYLPCALEHRKKNASNYFPCCLVEHQPPPAAQAVTNCLFEKAGCFAMGTTPPYPACRDAGVPGDPGFTSMADLAGDWYKVHAWEGGEPIECKPCQRAEISAPDASDAVAFTSNWTAPDCEGVQRPMGAVARMAADPARGGGAKLWNTGEMFGLTYWEPYTLVHDGSKEAEPFLLFYVCGGTVQGNYTTAFALAAAPSTTPAAQTRIAGIVESKLQMQWSNWCTVDNSCFAH